VNNWTFKALAPVGWLACLSLSGCLFVGDDDNGHDAPDPVGSVTVTWSIDGIQDPNDCIDFGVDRLELRLYTLRGDLIREVEPFCEDFAVTVDMTEGRYDGEATLVDSDDGSATITEPLDNIDIVAGTDLQIDVDFPVDSFL
jgi:hypothetical protein